jgi:hypothetical protein
MRYVISYLSILFTLAACAQPDYQPYSGPVAAPQVTYRIDEQRYFEVVPREEYACARARLYYVDKARNIRTNVVSWDRVSDSTFVIDATNDQYLVAPIVLSSSDCQTGGGDLCAPSLYYSQDSGRTWQINKPPITLAGGDVYLIGDTIFYAGRRAKLSAIATEGDHAWVQFYLTGPNKLPPIGKAPLDRRLQCHRNANG